MLTQWSCLCCGAPHWEWPSQTSRGFYCSSHDHHPHPPTRQRLYRSGNSSHVSLIIVELQMSHWPLRTHEDAECVVMFSWPGSSPAASTYSHVMFLIYVPTVGRPGPTTLLHTFSLTHLCSIWALSWALLKLWTGSGSVPGCPLWDSRLYADFFLPDCPVSTCLLPSEPASFWLWDPLTCQLPTCPWLPDLVGLNPTAFGPWLHLPQCSQETFTLLFVLSICFIKQCLILQLCHSWVLVLTWRSQLQIWSGCIKSRSIQYTMHHCLLCYSFYGWVINTCN